MNNIYAKQCPVCHKAKGGKGHSACSRELQKQQQPKRKSAPKSLDKLACFLKGL